jgi:hypothetical protein
MRRLLYLLAAAETADTASTAVAMANGGHEANPVVLAALQAGGWPAVIDLKILAFAVAAYIAMSRPTRAVRAAVIGVTVALFLIAASNLFIP